MAARTGNTREPPPREPLSRAKVLRSAVALADTEGLDALSMRRLAEGLGVVPMALYKHVSDKEDLLSGVVDELVGEFDSVDPEEHRLRNARQRLSRSQVPADQDWQEGVRRRVLAARAVVRRHPWSRRLIETRTVRTAAVLGHMEAITQALLRGGLSADLTHHVMHALGNRIWGFSPELFNDPTGSDAVQPDLDPANYPAILAVSADAAARRPGAVGCDEDFEFSFALDLILDAASALQEGRWESRAPTER